jgi:hypothetical protein
MNAPARVPHPEPIARYQVYVLRVWQAQAAGSSGPAVWHLSLDDLLRKERHGFADLESLLCFLRAEMDAADPGRAMA